MFRHYRQYIRMHLCKTYFYVYRVCLLLIHLHLFSKQRYFPTGVCPCGILTPHFILNSLSSTTADIFCPNSCQSFRRRVLSSSLVTRIGPAFLDKPQSFLWTVSKPSKHGHLFLGATSLQQRLTSFMTSVAHQDLDKSTLNDG